MEKWLAEGFDYGTWANGKWLDVLPKFVDQERASKVVCHMAFAEAVWLDRLLGRAMTYPNPAAVPKPTLETFQDSGREWKAWLTTADLDETRTFTRFDGTQHVYALGDVVRHVINHGTYHRGHLRGLAEAEGWDGFEDTDWVAWLRAAGRSPEG